VGPPAVALGEGVGVGVSVAEGVGEALEPLGDGDGERRADGVPSRAIRANPRMTSSTPAITTSTTQSQIGRGPSFWRSGLSERAGSLAGAVSDSTGGSTGASLMLHRLVVVRVSGFVGVRGST